MTVVKKVALKAPSDGGPAFPTGGAEWDDSSKRYDVAPMAGGMSLRDYFAAKALPGIMARNWDEQLKRDGDDAVVKTWAASVYAIADAMLEARKK